MLGLKGRYENDQRLNVLIKSIAALAFVPEGDLRPVFNELVGEFPNDVACEELLVYFNTNYVTGVQVGNRAREPMFPPILWNHTIDAIISAPKTTNAAEGYHNALNSLFLCQHPNIWKFLRGIVKDINVHQLTLAQATVGNNPNPREKYKVLAERLSAKVGNYHQEVDKMKYLRAIAHITSS